MKGRPKQLLKEANIKIDFKRMVAEKKYTKDYIYRELGTRYFLEPSTIERICWGQYDSLRRRRTAEPPNRAQAA
ncbi:hypothetical protein [Hymenobacter rubripertinctus]|uniref:Uncharacterized protein n=1 Tax=Hymenobacter rubripertinctus TaxID=2029981 RepID=A0A418QMM6_9BACT|nr:hypothetical protein [Hymenobacter rubripertinctus]RIY06476.1 hypothetical protein D0T11_18725 [Hymenobacter rubripertinctus]